jgi:hypothetical protein
VFAVSLIASPALFTPFSISLIGLGTFGIFGIFTFGILILMVFGLYFWGLFYLSRNTKNPGLARVKF